MWGLWTPLILEVIGPTGPIYLSPSPLLLSVSPLSLARVLGQQTYTLSMCPSGRNLHPDCASSSSSAAVILSFRPAFYVLDVDCDGKISDDDLHSFYARFCHHDPIKGDVVGSMMTVADTNGDGFVEYEEFEGVLEMAGSGTSAWGGGVVMMKEVFRVMDKHDGDGKVGHKDLKSFMNWAGIAVTDQDIDDMIVLGGGDKNDGVSFDGFIGILGLRS